jgi:hypothetical protein
VTKVYHDVYLIAMVCYNELMIQVKLLAKQDPKTTEMFEDFGREIQKTYDSMKAPFEAVFDARQQALKTFLPIQNSLIQLANSVAPTIATFEHFVNNMPSIKFPALEYKETFSIPYVPPVRPLSANEIAELVVRKLSDKETVSRTIAQPDNSPAIKLPKDKNLARLELSFIGPSIIAIRYEDQHIGNYDYSNLGLCRRNTKSTTSDYQWALLKQLAIIFEYGDKMFIPTVANLASHLNIPSAQLTKRMSILSKKLSIVLNITEDPFFPYNPDRGYKLKFKLRPEAILRGDGELHRSGGEYRDGLTSEDDKYSI